MQAQSSSGTPVVTTTYDVTVSAPTFTTLNPVVPANVFIQPTVTQTKPTVAFGPISPITVGSLSSGFCAQSFTSIIQDCGLRATPFEQNIVSLYLAAHGIPVTDLPLVYQYGTSDLRNSLRAFMLNYLNNVIEETPSSRSASDQNLYNWLSAKVENEEVAYYNAIKTEYDKWQSDPCTFQEDPRVVQTPYYGSEACGLSGTVTSPEAPNVSYFESVGLVDSYGEVAEDAGQAAANMVLDTERRLYTAQSLGTLGGSIPVGIAGAAIVYANLASIAPAIQGQLLPAVGGFTTAYNAAVQAENGTELAIAGDVGVVGTVGAYTVVLTAALITAEAAINLSNTDANQAAINALLNYNANQPPNLLAMVQDPVGFQKITQVFLAATLPDSPPSAAPPAYSPTNAQQFFVIDSFEAQFGDGKPGNLKPAFTYESWNPTYPVYPYTNAGQLDVSFYGNGWLVQSNAAHAGTNDPQIQTFSLSFDYIDPTSNLAYTAETVGNGRFLLTKSPALLTSQDTPCPASLSTGLTPYIPLPATCSTAVVNNLNIQIEGQNPNLLLGPGPLPGEPPVLPLPPGLSYNVVNPQPPVFATQNFVDFTVGQIAHFIPELDASTNYPLAENPPGPPTFGSNIPTCALSVPGALPEGVVFDFNGSASGFYAYPAPNTEGSLTLNLTATCDGVSTVQPFTINIAPGSGPSANAVPAQPHAALSVARAVAHLMSANTPSTTTGPQFVLPTPGEKFSLAQGESTIIPVYTSGGVTIITAGANALPTGMNLSDNGNGSATITGIPAGPPPACTSSCDSAIHGTDQYGNSTTLTLAFAVNAPALPAIASAQTASWPAGQANQTIIDASKTANNTPTAIPLTFATVGQWPAWATLTDDKIDVVTITGTPPVSAYGQTVPLQYQYSYGGGQFASPVYSLNVKVAPPKTALMVSPRLLFQVSEQGSGSINSVTSAGMPGLTGTFLVNGPLPNGLTSSQSGTSLTIGGTPTYPGIFQIPVQFTDAANNVVSKNVKLEIAQPASFTGYPTEVTIYTGIPVNLSYPVSAGFPASPGASPGDGLPGSLGSGLILTGASGTTNGITFGTQTGALTIAGTPLEPATYNLSLSAQPILVDTSVSPSSTGSGVTNTSTRTPVGSVATATLTVNVIASPGTCDGQIITQHHGDLIVAKDQICQISGGTVYGNLISKGGIVLLNNATISGNVQIDGDYKQLASMFPIQVCGSTIGGDLRIGNEPNNMTIGGPSGSSCGPNTINGSLQILLSYGTATVAYNTIKGYLLASGDATSITVTNNQAKGNVQFLFNNAPVVSSSNTIGGNLEVLANSLSSSISNNTISKYLVCDFDASISGSGNTAEDKQGQCASF